MSVLLFRKTFKRSLFLQFMQTKPGVFVQKRRLANLFFFFTFCKSSYHFLLKTQIEFSRLHKKKQRKKICIHSKSSIFAFVVQMTFFQMPSHQRKKQLGQKYQLSQQQDKKNPAVLYLPRGSLSTKLPTCVMSIFFSMARKKSRHLAFQH